MRIDLDTLGAWVIKCNPAVTDLAPMVATGRANPSWCVAENYRTRLMAPGQQVVFWVSAYRQRGIWGAGTVTAAPAPVDGALRVGVCLPLLSRPVTAAELKVVPGLAGIEPLRAPQQSNPSWLHAGEWDLVAPLLSAAR